MLKLLTPFFSMAYVASKPKKIPLASVPRDVSLLKNLMARSLSYSWIFSDVAPEVLHLKNFSKAADFWSLGCLLYELFYGETPFPRDNKNPIYEEMAQKSLGNGPAKTFVNFPDHERKLSAQVKELITRLLITVPKDRLGSWHGTSDIKCHCWLADLPRWKAIEDLQVEPPYVPEATDLQTWTELETKRNKGRELNVSSEPDPVTPSKEIDRLCFVINS
jgi:serine/threonine protein kinase